MDARQIYNNIIRLLERGSEIVLKSSAFRTGRRFYLPLLTPKKNIWTFIYSDGEKSYIMTGSG